jgi:hypothetical protein
MHKGENENALTHRLIDESVISDKKLSNVRGINFRYRTAALGKGPQ